MLFLDSANLKEAEAALATGLIAGITTNPALLAQQTDAPDGHIAALMALAGGRPVFRQLRHADVDGMLEEVAGFPDRLSVKIPATLNGMTVASRLWATHEVAMTAIFSPAQVALACSARAQFVIPYMNRATDLLGDGGTLVRSMRDIIDSQNSKTRILAASLKSPEEVVAALVAGAHDVSVPWLVLAAMADHELSRAAIAQFDQEAP